MAVPIVSVITPTWHRADVLLNRCIPSVTAAAEDYQNVEHIVVSDGPDPELAAMMADLADDEDDDYGYLRFAELPEHDAAARWGHHARLRAAELARGDLFCYLDDDNAFRPDHIWRLAAALEEHPGAGFAYSQILMNGHGDPYVVGTSPPQLGGIDTSAIMHRRELLDVATWRCNGWQQTVDWDLVQRWLDAGTEWAFVPEVTADYYFSA